MAEIDVEAAKQKAEVMAAKLKEEGLAAFALAKERGFFSHFNEYCMHLIMPWTVVGSSPDVVEAQSIKDKTLVILSKAQAEIVRTLTLQRAVDPSRSFIFYNVVAFWAGVTQSVLEFMFTDDGLISLTWNGGVSFCVAYTLFWCMTCAGTKMPMFFAMCFLMLYIGLNVYLGLGKLIYIVPALFYFGKALANVLMLVNGYFLYKDVIGPEGTLML